MKFYKYIFCFLYTEFSKTDKTIPEWSSAIVLSLLILFNLLSIILFIQINFNIVFYQHYEILLLPIIFINYMIFISDKKQNEILKEYRNKRKKVWDIIVVIYLIFSVTLFLRIVGMDFLNILFILIILAIISLIANFDAKY